MTATAVAHVDVDAQILRDVAAACAEHHAIAHHEQQGLPDDTDEAPDVDDPATWRYWLRGLLERARIKGAVDHQWFRTYWRDDNPWTIWGGRPEGMPAFPRGVSRPAPPSTGGKRDGAYDRIVPGSWWEDWTRRTLGVERRDATDLVQLAFEQLAVHEVVDQREAPGGPFLGAATQPCAGLRPARPRRRPPRAAL